MPIQSFVLTLTPFKHQILIPLYNQTMITLFVVHIYNPISKIQTKYCNYYLKSHLISINQIIDSYFQNK